MPSFKTSAAVLAATLFSISVSSQAIYTIDPDTVSLATRQGWCSSQTAACPLLCLQLSGESSTTAANDCDPEALSYECICGNGLSPNASEYSQTLPYFECQEYGNQCVKACNGNSPCQSACRDDHPCGAQNPTRVNTTSSVASSTNAPAGATGAGGVVYNGLGGDAGTTTAASGAQSTGTDGTKKNGAQMALDIGRSYSFAVVFAGLFAGFALVM
ncbi:hypothetical protein BKA64DRAFT_644729 [Cadophora sp. MPI-SDFR-AT-0126]|nr:hypothetical protein BKA64DRAFT_644729 [Leotiomycetes sp. MPI-SDFR-AT-0126]